MTEDARFAEIAALVLRAYESAYGSKATPATEFASSDEHASDFVGAIAEALGNPDSFYDAQDVFHDNECELRDVIQAIVDAVDS